MIAWLRRLHSRWTAFADTPQGKRWLQYVRYGGTLGIAVYLVYRLSTIGWTEIGAALPRTPWFYVLFGVLYLIQPITQALIYQIIWPVRALNLLPATLVKRVYDRELLNYSGDVYLYIWARNRQVLSARRVLHTIKDNAIVSSIASTGIAFGLLALFVLSGVLPLPNALTHYGWTYSIGGALVLSIVVLAGVQLRHAVFSLPGRLLLLLLGLHAARIIAAQTVQVAQWSVVEPSVPLWIWCTFLAVQIMTGRLPLLPSKDLLFVAIGMELAGAVNLPVALVAGLLGVQSVLDKGTNLLVFGAASVWMQQSDVLPAEEAAMPPWAQAETNADSPNTTPGTSVRPASADSP